MKISSLYYYPVKSLKGVEVQSLTLGKTGPLYDRAWMIVDPSGKFLTQRQHPKLALVEVRVQEGELRFNGPNKAPISISQRPSARDFSVQVWADTCRGLGMDPAIDQWLSDYLHTPCHLVCMNPEFERKVDSSFAQSAADVVGFADAFPLHITNQASLEDLNRELEIPVPMNRFRPNIVIEGAVEWDEDTWAEISVGDLLIAVVKPRTRCSIINTDQQTGQRGRQPLTHLATTRKFGKGIMFGQLAIHRQEGDLRVGQEVKVTQRGLHPSLNPSPLDVR